MQPNNGCPEDVYKGIIHRAFPHPFLSHEGRHGSRALAVTPEAPRGLAEQALAAMRALSSLPPGAFA